MGPAKWYWFELFLKYTVEDTLSKEFDTACQLMQDKFFELTVNTLIRHKKDDESWENNLLQYCSSESFAVLYFTQLPGNLSECHSGCVMLFMILSEIHMSWFSSALRDVR